MGYTLEPMLDDVQAHTETGPNGQPVTIIDSARLMGVSMALPAECLRPLSEIARSEAGFRQREQQFNDLVTAQQNAIIRTLRF